LAISLLDESLGGPIFFHNPGNEQPVDNFFTDFFTNDFKYLTPKPLEITLFIGFLDFRALFQCPFHNPRLNALQAAIW